MRSNLILCSTVTNRRTLDFNSLAVDSHVTSASLLLIKPCEVGTISDPLHDRTLRPRKVNDRPEGTQHAGGRAEVCIQAEAQKSTLLTALQSEQLRGFLTKKKTDFEHEVFYMLIFS